MTSLLTLSSPSHTHLNQLIGGMKAKVVLASACRRPSVLIVNELTNYPDTRGSAS